MSIPAFITTAFCLAAAAFGWCAAGSKPDPTQRAAAIVATPEMFQ